MLKEEFKQVASTPKELKNFGFTVGFVFIIVGAWAWYGGHGYLAMLVGIGALFVFAGAFFPRMLRPIQRPWMMLALVIGWLVTRAALLFVFYCVVTPVGLVANVFGKKFLDLGFRDKTRESYWFSRNQEITDNRRYEKQF